MRIVVVGATGTIGSAVMHALDSAGHDVVQAAHADGDVRMDLSDPSSIARLYESVRTVDAVVCAAGRAQFGALQELDDAGFALSLENKIMGQVNLVRLGLNAVVKGGSFTLTTGTLSIAPTAGTAAVAMAGGAVESFVRAAALDLAPEHRLNAVSPGWVAESRVAMGLEPMPGIWAADLAQYYRYCVESDISGEVLIAEHAMGPEE